MPIQQKEVFGYLQPVFVPEYLSYRDRGVRDLSVLNVDGIDALIKKLYPDNQGCLCYGLDDPDELLRFAGKGADISSPSAHIADMLALAQDYPSRQAAIYLHGLFQDIHIQLPRGGIRRFELHENAVLPWMWENFVMIGREHEKILDFRALMKEADRSVPYIFPNIDTSSTQLAQTKTSSGHLRIDYLWPIEHAGQAALLSLYEVLHMLPRYQIDPDLSQAVDFLNWARQASNLDRALIKYGAALPRFE